MKNVLILCTGNSARSLIGEVVVRERGKERFNGFSAGSKPTGKPNPGAIQALGNAGYGTAGLRSKSWDEFALPSAPAMDIVITVCDSAASEECPYWPGAPVRAHWGLPDPAAVENAEEACLAFAATVRAIEARVDALLALSDDELTSLNLNQIGAMK
jgi:arsenate reductase